MGQCASCGKEVADGDLLITDKGEVCDACEAEARFAPAPASSFSTPEVVGLVLGILPFCVSFNTGSSVTQNGVTTSSFYFDYVAVPAGLLCLPFSLFLAVRGRSSLTGIAIAGVVFLLGIVQLARGFGVVQLVRGFVGV